MAIKLPTNLLTLVDKFYKKEIERLFPEFVTGSTDVYSPNGDWRDARGTVQNRSGPLYPPEPLSDDSYYQGVRISYYLSKNGSSFPIDSPQDLFALTKMLSVPVPKDNSAITVTRAFESPTPNSRGEGYFRLKTIGKIGPGVSDSTKEAIFKAKILPNLKQHYLKIQKSSALDSITKSLLRAWFEENEGSLFKSFLAIAEDIKDVKSLNELDDAMIDIRGIENRSVKLKDNFFVSIFKKDGKLDSNVFDALGFSNYLRDNMNLGFFGGSFANTSKTQSISHLLELQNRETKESIQYKSTTTTLTN